MLNRHKNAAIVTAVWFGLNAGGWASFVVRLPHFKEMLGLTDSRLGVVLFAAACVAIPAVKLSGYVTARVGSRPVMVATAYGLALSLVALGYSADIGQFVVCLMLVVFIVACMDVAMNAHGVALERASQEVIMGRLHACWSLGGIVGGGLGGWAAGHSISIAQHGWIAGMVVAFIAMALQSQLLPSDADKHQKRPQKSQRRRSPFLFVGLGLLGLCAAIVEGSAIDWGAVYLRDVWHATPDAAALPYVLFQSGMVLGRVFGDRAAAKIGRAQLLLAGGCLAAAGLTLGLIVGGVAATLIAWTCMGIGVSVVIPMTFSMAGTIAEREFAGGMTASQAVGTVSAISYSAFFIGPPVIGFLASTWSLRAAMVVPATLALGIVVGGALLRRRASS